jgi:hypothetical protein
MVNLRKVGAIATGALFVGATLGMAAAVTVPSDFTASMLADNGVAKAQLVVGKDAPGKTADEASAKIIADAAKTKLTYTVPGGDIKITYGVNKWDDSSTASNWIATEGQVGISLGTDPKTTNSTEVDGKIINVSKGSYGFLMIDKNGDGDFKDSTQDYNIYSGLYVIDGSAGTVQPLYNFSTDYQSSWSLGSSGSTTYYYVGNTFKVKGKKYTFSKEDGEQEIKIGPTITKTLSSTDKPVTEASTVEGTLKLAYRNDTTAARTLYFLDGTDILGTFQTTGGVKSSISESSIPSGAFRDYRIWYSSQEGNTQLKVWMVKKADEIDLVDEQKDVLGYYQVRVNDSGFKGGNGLYFLDNAIDLKLGSSVDIPGTEYYIKWKTDKTMQLRRKKATTVASGTKMLSAMSDYSPFLTADITPTAVAQGRPRHRPWKSLTRTPLAAP